MLILRRLGELREAPVGPARDARRPGTPTRVDSSARGGRGSLLSRSGRPDVERRFAELEDRLAAIERCFLEATAAERQRLQREVVARVSPRPSAEPGGAKLAASGPAGQDFGGLPYRMTGVAGDGLMSDVLQMLASNQKTGRFSLFVGGTLKRFDAFLREGEIVHAIAGEMTGDAAFFALMATGQEDGYYGFLEEDIAGIPKTIEAKTQFLILDALRRIDEGRNAGPDSPSQGGT